MINVLIVLVFFLVVKFLSIILKIRISCKKLCRENLIQIKYYLDLKRNYLIYISDKNRPNWKKIIDEDKTFFITDKGNVKKTQIKLFCVLYKSGEILHISRNLENIPKDAYWIDNNENLDFTELDAEEVEFNSTEIPIKIKESKNPSKVNYTTEITNNMKCKLYPVAFGGYLKKDNKYVLNNVIETVYSETQFLNWYNCPNDYISPGETVCDPNNYGGEDGYWIYIFETESGNIKKVGVSEKNI